MTDIDPLRNWEKQDYWHAKCRKCDQPYMAPKRVTICKLCADIVVAAAQQPAEQKPISHDWDDQDKCRRCGDRDWYASATCTPKY